MHSHKFLIVLLIAFSHLSYGAAELYRPMAESVGKDAYEVELIGTSFTQSSSFDNDGLEEEQIEGNSYSKIDGDLNLRYGFSKAIELKLLGRFRLIGGARTVGTVEESISVSGTESFGGGIKYVIKPQRNWRFALEFEYRQSLYDNVDFPAGSAIPNTEDFVLGDSGTEITFTGHIAYRRSSKHYFSGAMSYRMPSNSLSHELPYFIESVWPFSTWAFKVGLKGIVSLGGDEFSDNPAAKPSQNTGPTRLWNSVNREVLTPYGGVSYAFESFRVDLFGGQTFSGVSTDKGLELGLGIVWRSKGKSAELEKISSFKEYEIEAAVIKISPRGKFIKIDQGVSGDVEKGMRFDVYQTDFFGGNVLVASGIIFEVGADWSIIKLTKKYKKIQIKKGFAARGG